MSITLTHDGVESAILRARIEQDTAMGLRMDGFVDRVNTKLDDHSRALGTEMQALGEKLESSVNKVLTKQIEQEQRFEERAALDDAFRKTTTEEIRNLRHRMKLLGWLMMVSKTAKDIFIGTTTMMQNGKGVLAGIAAVCSSISVLWLFFKQMLPYIQQLLHHR